MRPYQPTLSAVEVERGRPSWEPDDGDFNEPPGVAPPLAARIAPLKPPALLEQLTPRERSCSPWWRADRRTPRALSDRL